jgi:hypothetical protein
MSVEAGIENYQYYIILRKKNTTVLKWVSES